MPSRVVELFACWWTGGSTRSAVVWKMVPYCLLWCLWSERKVQIFEDREMTLDECKSLFFYSLYIWTAAFVAFWRLVFMIFLFLFLLVRCFSCILHVYLGCAFVFDDISITYPKKKVLIITIFIYYYRNGP
jgi:hypothetical protein